jgi:hypothetical protein
VDQKIIWSLQPPSPGKYVFCPRPASSCGVARAMVLALTAIDPANATAIRRVSFIVLMSFSSCQASGTVGAS